MARNEDFFILKPGKISLSELKKIYLGHYHKFVICTSAHDGIKQAVEVVQKVIRKGQVVYGVNTGFGKLANTRIPTDNLVELQHNLVLSHCVGVGEYVDDALVKLITVLKINSLARGHSGVRLETMKLLLKFINQGYFPCIPCQGSVGASGDLAPLAHLVAPLIGEGYVKKNGKVISAVEALTELNEQPIELGPLEGLSLLNGTQVSTAFALKGFFEAEGLLSASVLAGAMSVDALRGSTTPFRSEIHELRGQHGQKAVAEALSVLLRGSEIRNSHENCEKVQDPYSLRCQPQVVGACLDQLNHAARILEVEANAVTNNPIVMPETGEILSGGNFHAEPVAFVSDSLAIILSEIASISERRTALMVDPNFSGLPAFLINGSGLNSGFMIAQVTAAALVSENKSLCFPCSVDSIPTSASQEDHVSMATHAARRLFRIAENTKNVIAIEFLSAAQALDFLRPLRSSQILEKTHAAIRERVSFYKKDRFMANDMKSIAEFVGSLNLSFFSQSQSLSILPNFLEMDDLIQLSGENHELLQSN